MEAPLRPFFDKDLQPMQPFHRLDFDRRIRKVESLIFEPHLPRPWRLGI